MPYMKKWNPKKRAYEPYVVPSDWHTPVYTSNMDEPVNCASCGRTMRFGDGYTSRQIHTKNGMGYSVCLKCYERERKEESAHGM